MIESGQPTSFATSRPVAIFAVFLAMVVFGTLSYDRLAVQLMPELSYPTLTIRTEYEGAAPEEVENDITRPIEEAVGVVGGLKRLSSVSRAGLSDVVLEFGWDQDVGEATQDVLEKLDLVFLPDEATRPLILHFDPNLDPIMDLSLAGDAATFAGEEGLRRLRRVAELQVKRQLEPIKGVAAVRVKGGLEEQVSIDLDEAQLLRTGISIQQVITRIEEENVNVAGGTLTEGRIEYMVRTLNEFEDVSQIANTVVASFDGREVRVRDIGTVSWSQKDREIDTRMGGQRSVQIEVYKEGDANIVGVAKAVRDAVGEPKIPETDAGAAKPRLGPPQRASSELALAARLLRDEGVRLEVVADRSIFIQSSIDEVRNTAILGGLLAIAVLFLFLGEARPTAIIAASIPISLLVTFAPLHMLGVSLNIMSLGGLALGVGMLVDASIVVLEAIHRRREDGEDLIAATVHGTQEVFGAVWASTLTSVAVFLPMVFVEGVAGQAFGDLGLAVVTSLLVSTIVALYLVPMLASRGTAGFATPIADTSAASIRFKRLWSWEAFRHSWSTASRPARLSVVLPLYWIARLILGTAIEIVGKLLALVAGLILYALRAVLKPLAKLALRISALPARAVTGLLDRVAAAYPAVLRVSLRNRAAVLLVIAAIGWLAFEAGRRLDSELLPEVHQGEFTVEVALPVGTPIEETDRLLAPVERALLEEPGIEKLIVTVGFDSENSQRSDEGEHTARFKIILEDSHRGEAAESLVVERIRTRLLQIPDVEARVVRPVLFSQRTPIEVEIHGDDLVRLRTMAERVRVALAALPELADVDTTQRRGAPEVQIVYDRERLMRYELDIASVARLVRDKVQGNEATQLNLHDRRVPIVVRLGEEDRSRVQDVRALIVNPGQATPIPLSAVADVTLGEGPAEVRRIDGQRIALVRANLGDATLGAAVAAIEDTLRNTVDWPDDMSFVIGGQNEEWERSKASLWLALGLSVFLVYVVMAFQFESLVQPLVIMVTIPLAFVGTVLTLLALSIPLSVVVFLGMIMLAGIVVNNAIVLIDYVNQLRARGLPRDAALARAGVVRLRPILMTTGTTVLGLLPLALGIGDGAELRAPMAIAVVSGLIVSTVLTLLVIPTVYVVADDIATWIFGRAVQRASDPVATTNADRVLP